MENTRAAGLTVTTEVTGARRPLPPGVELSAYRIVQEALSNVLRHALGATAHVTLAYGPRSLRVEVVNTAPTREAAPSEGPGTGCSACGSVRSCWAARSPPAPGQVAATASRPASPCPRPPPPTPSPGRHRMIRVLIADDQQMVRQGFTVLLNTQPDIEVVGQAVNGLEAVEKVAEVPRTSS